MGSPLGQLPCVSGVSPHLMLELTCEVGTTPHLQEKKQAQRG